MIKGPEIKRYELFHWDEFQPFHRRRDLPCFNDRTYWFAYGRQALSYGLQLLGISAGDKVLVPSYICNVIESAFVPSDIAITYYNVREDTEPDFEDLAKKMDKKTKALLAVNYYGLPAPIAAIRAFCEDHGLLFIEDNAQGFLNQVKGRSLGTVGDIGFTSVRKSLPLPNGATLTIHPKFSGKIPPPPGLTWRISQKSLAFMFYYFRQLIMGSKIPPFAQIRRHHRQKKKAFWGNAPHLLPDKYMAVSLDPLVPFIVQAVNYETFYQNKKRKLNRLLTFLKSQSLFSGDIFLKDDLAEMIPFQIPFHLKDPQGERADVLTSLNQQGIEAFYWPDLPQAVVADPVGYPWANYFKNNLIHFPL
jgi:hypothetical protein